MATQTMTEQAPRLDSPILLIVRVSDAAEPERRDAAYGRCRLRRWSAHVVRPTARGGRSTGVGASEHAAWVSHPALAQARMVQVWHPRTAVVR